jgi:ATP-dependent DNA ligase
MFKRIDFCLPTKSTAVPSSPDWLHEVKYDGYRLRLDRDSDRIRLITRGAHNQTAAILGLGGNRLGARETPGEREKT